MLCGRQFYSCHPVSSLRAAAAVSSREPNLMRKQRASVFSIIAATLVSTVSALATDYPSRTLTIVVPFPAGAGVDVTARSLADRLGTKLGQSVVVENRPGASGLVGAAAVARANPDGHTLLMTPNTLFIA